MSENFLAEDKIQKQITVWELLKHLWPYFKRQKFLLVSSLLVVLALAAVGRVLPRLIGYAIDEGIVKSNAQVLTQVALLFLFFECLNIIFNFLNSYLFSRFGNNLLAHIRTDQMKKFYALPLDYFNTNPTGRIINRLTHDVSAVGDLFSEALVSVFVQSVVLISLIFAMALISWKMTLATIFIAPMFFFISLKLTGRIRNSLQAQKKSFAAVNSFMTETMNGLKIVQLFNSEKKQISKFKTSYQEYTDNSFISMRSFALMQPLLNLMSACLISFALLVGGYAALKQALPLGLIVSFILYTQDIVPPIREILERWQGFQNSLSSADRVFQFLNEGEEEDLGQKSLDIWSPIEFRNLSFRYNETLEPALKNINLRIAAGQSVALVGRSGSGKTTLTSLLQRLYLAPKSSIFLNNTDICDIQLTALRTHIGIIQQDNFIFKGSIRQNVTLLKQDITDLEVQTALEQIGLWQLLQRQNRDLDFQVEEKGLNLSSGERQLLAFSRILVSNPEVLILDEATASVDSETEKLIQAATEILTKNRTSIIVAHRLSTIRNCDLIVAMKDGQIVEQGSHEELMKAQAYYYQLAEAGLKSMAI